MTQVPQLLPGMLAGLLMSHLASTLEYSGEFGALCLLHQLVLAAVSLPETTLHSWNLQLCGSPNLRMKTNLQSMQACEEGEVLVGCKRQKPKMRPSLSLSKDRGDHVWWEPRQCPTKGHVLRPASSDSSCKQELLRPPPAHQVLNLTLRASNTYLSLLHPLSLTH